MTAERAGAHGGSARLAWLRRAKLEPPATLVSLLARPNLLELLNEGTVARLTLVLAAAGFGKSTLLSQWREELVRRGARVAWLTCDEEDCDPGRFCIYVANALHAGGVPMDPHTLSAINGVDEVDWMRLLAHLLNEVSSLPGPVVLILDDFERTDTPEINRLLESFLADMPHNMHLAVASRVRPNLSLAKLSARGLVRELDGEALRFSRHELLDFFGSAVPATDVPMLAERTEGWPVAVQFALLWLRSSQDAHSQLATFSGRTRQVAAYMAEQILVSMRPELQRFLIETSILENIERHVADAVRESQNSHRLLEEIGALAPLVTTRFEPERTCRLHPLFAEFLRDLLAREGADVVRTLYARAARHYAVNNQLTAAMRLACKGEQEELAARFLLDAGIFGVYLQDGVARLRTVMGLLSDRIIEANPRLRLGSALVMAKAGRLAEAWALVKQVRGAAGVSLDSMGFPATPLEADLILIESIFENYRRVVPPEDYVAGVQRMVYCGGNDGIFLSVLESVLAHVQQRRGDLDKSEFAAQAVLARYKVLHSNYGEVSTEIHFALNDAARGRLVAVERRLNSMLRRTHRDFRADVGLAAVSKAILADISYERNDLTGAGRWVEQAEDWLESIQGWFDFYAMGYGTAARLAFWAKGLDAAMSVLDRARQACDRNGLRSFDVWLNALRVQFLCASGNKERAAQVAVSLQPVEKLLRDTHWRQRDAVLIALAMVAIEHGDVLAARNFAQQMMAHAATGPRGVSLMRAHLLVALADCVEQREEAALHSVEEALRLGYPESVIRPFLDFGLVGRTAIERLLAQASQRAESEGHRAFASQVLQAMRADTVVVDTLTLTARESLILEELSKGATNKVIARRLSLSERTVKLLLAHLFTKLNVTHRRAAATEARRRGLLPDVTH